jgi:hypothetical protein
MRLRSGDRKARVLLYNEERPHIAVRRILEIAKRKV